MRAFGSNVITSKGTDLGSGDVLGANGGIIMDEQKAGENIFSYVYNAHWKSPPPAGSINPSWVGTHFIQIRNVKRVGDQFSLEYWDYGKWKPHSISLDGLKRATFGILTTKD